MPSSLQPKHSQDILNPIFHSNFLPTDEAHIGELHSSHIHVLQEKATANLGKRHLWSCLEPSQLQIWGWEAASPGSTGMGRTRSGGSQRSLCQSLCSFFPRLGLKLSSLGKRARHLPLSGELVPDTNVFPARSLAALPAPRQPQQPPRLPHLLDAERFPRQAQTWPQPHFPKAKWDIFRGSPGFPHPLPPPWGAAMPAEGEQREAPHRSRLCGGSRWSGTRDSPGGGWMDGPPKDTGTPRGRRAAVLSRREMDGGTPEGRSCAFPMKHPRRAERGAALSRRGMDGGTSKGYKDPQNAQGTPKTAGTAYPQGAARPAATLEPSALTCGVAIAAIAPPGPALFKLGGPGAAASALSRGRPGGAAGGRPSGQGAGAALPLTAPGPPPRQPPAEVGPPPPPALRGNARPRSPEAVGRSGDAAAAEVGEGEAGGVSARGGTEAAGPWRRGRDRRHSGRYPAPCVWEAWAETPAGGPQPGPFVLGPSGGSQFQFSRRDRGRRFFVGEPAKWSSPWDGCLDPIPGTGRFLSQCWALGKFSPAELPLHTQDLGFLLNIWVEKHPPAIVAKKHRAAVLPQHHTEPTVCHGPSA